MKAIILTLLIFASHSLTIASIDIGSDIPNLTISDKGELVLNEDDISYQPWDTKALAGKVHVVQYLAARMSAKTINEPFTDKVDSLDFPANDFHFTTIINMNDAFFGTSGFVIGEVKSNKRKYPQTSIVADKNGKGAKQWQLNSKSSAIIILSDQGKILFFKDGGLNTDEINKAINLIQHQIDQRQEKKVVSTR